MADVTVRFTGPLFDGVAEILVEEYCGKLERVLGERAFDVFHEMLDDSIRVNHGVYTGYIRLTQDERGTVVDDGWSENNDLPYGLWLEGIGSRNSPVTIFEGYHSLERTREQIESEVEDTAYELLDGLIEEMNS